MCQPDRRQHSGVLLCIIALYMFLFAREHLLDGHWWRCMLHTPCFVTGKPCALPRHPRSCIQPALRAPPKINLLFNSLTFLLSAVNTCPVWWHVASKECAVPSEFSRRAYCHSIAVVAVNPQGFSQLVGSGFRCTCPHAASAGSFCCTMAAVCNSSLNQRTVAWPCWEPDSRLLFRFLASCQPPVLNVSLNLPTSHHWFMVSVWGTPGKLPLAPAC